MSDKKSVVEALAAVMAELPAIQKSDSGQGVSYKFRGIETLVGHLSPLLAKHGVIIVPSSRIAEINRDVQNSSGQMKGWTETILTVNWTIYGPACDSITATTVGIGRDNSDKGSNKAQTQAYKYLLMELFAIGDKSDDGDGIADKPAAAPTTIPDEVAVDFNARIAKLDADNKAKVAAQLKALGSVHIQKLPLDMLPAVVSIVTTAVLEDRVV